MIEFVLLACLLKDPSHCETFRFPFAPEHNMPQCVWQSQIWVAQWAGDHPDWVVRKVTCEMPET